MITEIKKTVQLLEQLNCKMDQLIEISNRKMKIEKIISPLLINQEKSETQTIKQCLEILHTEIPECIKNSLHQPSI